MLFRKDLLCAIDFKKWMVLYDGFETQAYRAVHETLRRRSVRVITLTYQPRPFKATKEL